MWATSPFFNPVYTDACLLKSDYCKDDYTPDDFLSNLLWSLSYAQISLLSIFCYPAVLCYLSFLDKLIPKNKNLGHDLRQEKTTFQSIIWLTVNFFVGEKKLYCPLHNIASFPPSLLFLVVQNCDLLLNISNDSFGYNIWEKMFWFQFSV